MNTNTNGPWQITRIHPESDPRPACNVARQGPRGPMDIQYLTNEYVVTVGMGEHPFNYLFANEEEAQAAIDHFECVLYMLIIRNERTGVYEDLTVYPMTRAECMTMKSKFHPERQSRITVRKVENAA